MSWSSKDKPNGSAALSVKQPLSPFWDARIGADMTVARQPGTLTASELLSEKLANGGSEPQSSGTAWAAITAPGVGSIWDKTAIEARVDPAQEQSKLGTSLSKSLPLSEQYSLTLQNGYDVIQQGIVPVPGIVARPARNYQTEQSAKLNIADTGTSFIAGQTLSSTDDKWLRKIGAEQKLFDGVTISGSVGETAQGMRTRVSPRDSSAAGDRGRRRLMSPIPVKDRALPHIGRDAVKIRGPDSVTLLRRAGDTRSTRNRGTADECDSF